MVLGGLSACGKGDESDSPSGGSGGSPTAGGVEVRTGVATGTLFEERPIGKPPEITTYEPLTDPSVANWTSEALAHQSAPALTEFFQALYFGSGTDEARLDAWLAEDFVGTTILSPSELVTLKEAGSLRIEAAGSVPADAFERAEIASLAAAAAARFEGDGGASQARIDLAITAVDAAAEAGPKLNLRVHASGQVEGSVRQVNSTWELELERSTAVLETRLRQIRLLDHEEVRIDAPSLTDHSGQVFDEVWFYAEQFLTGVDTLYGTQDFRSGRDFFAFQGLAVGDLTGDGLEDVYVCQPGGTPNRLLVGQEDGSVYDLTRQNKTAWLDSTSSALIVDLDGDGDQDLALAIHSDVMIGLNDGKGVMTWDRIKGDDQAGIWSLSAADPDLDGDLDLYGCRFSQHNYMAEVPIPYHDANTGASNVFYRNDGKAKFTDATEEVGLATNNAKYSLSALWEDFDGDGDSDLYVSNHYGRNSFYRNDRGYFREIGYDLGMDSLGTSTATVRADFDLNGTQDLFIAGFESAPGQRVSGQRDRFMAGRFVDTHSFYQQHARGNMLLRHTDPEASGGYEPDPLAAGASAGGAAWGAVLFDVDADGREDLVLPNGLLTAPEGGTDLESFVWREVVSGSPPEPLLEHADSEEADNPLLDAYRAAWGATSLMLASGDYGWAGGQRNRAFVNVGGRFVDASACIGVDVPDDARAAATVDWDGDGRLDLFVKNRTAPRLRFFHNQSDSSANWIAVELEGTRCNRDAIGARVVIELEGRTLEKSVHAGGGFLAQSSKRVHFGLGDQATVDTLRVHWPGGGSSVFEGVQANALLKIRQGEQQPERVQRDVPAIADREVAMKHDPLTHVARFAPVHKLPMAELVLPSYDNAERKVADFSESPTLVILWSLDVPVARKALESLGKHPEFKTEAGLRIAPMSIDASDRNQEARTLLDALELGQDAGQADQSLLLALEVLMTNLRGSGADLDLPVSMLLDPAGQMVATYLGRLDLQRLAHDLRMLSASDPKTLMNFQMLGGQWLYRRPRDYTNLVGQFSQIGRTDLAAFYGSLPSQ